MCKNRHKINQVERIKPWQAADALTAIVGMDVSFEVRMKALVSYVCMFWLQYVKRFETAMTKENVDDTSSSEIFPTRSAGE